MAGVIFNGFPVGVVDDGRHFRRALGHLHDHLDELGVDPAPVRVVDFDGEALDVLRVRRDDLKELAAVDVA